jgi:hypothetical protein
VIDDGKRIRVEASDGDRGQPVLKSPTPLDTSGRGLRIVEAMSESWGITPSSNGKTVWFELTGALSHTPPVASSSEIPDREAHTPRPPRERGRNRTSRGTRGTQLASPHPSSAASSGHLHDQRDSRTGASTRLCGGLGRAHARN